VQLRVPGLSWNYEYLKSVIFFGSFNCRYDKRAHVNVVMRDEYARNELRLICCYGSAGLYNNVLNSKTRLLSQGIK
jgi:hypothetical protein